MDVEPGAGHFPRVRVGVVVFERRRGGSIGSVGLFRQQMNISQEQMDASDIAPSVGSRQRQSFCEVADGLRVIGLRVKGQAELNVNGRQQDWLWVRARVCSR